MKNQIIGVIVGGLLALTGSYITATQNYKAIQWQSRYDQKIQAAREAIIANTQMRRSTADFLLGIGTKRAFVEDFYGGLQLLKFHAHAFFPEILPKVNKLENNYQQVVKLAVSKNATANDAKKVFSNLYDTILEDTLIIDKALFKELQTLNKE